MSRWVGVEMMGFEMALDASLQRMGFDQVDVIYANPPPRGMTVAALADAAGGLVASGRARAWAS